MLLTSFSRNFVAVHFHVMLKLCFDWRNWAFIVVRHVKLSCKFYRHFIGFSECYFSSVAVFLRGSSKFYFHGGQ